MTVIRLTQGAVDRLLASPPPARDSFYWSDREPGFGVRHKATSGRLSWIYQWRNRDGRSCRVTIGDARKVRLDAARKAMQELAGSIAGGRDPIEERRKRRASLSFAELVTRYQASPAWRDKAESTRRSDECRLRAFILPALGDRRLVEITPGDLKKLHATLCDPAAAEALARRGGATKATRRGGEGGARRTMRLLRAVFGFAVEVGELEANPAAALRLGSDGRRESAPDTAAYSRLWPAIARLRGQSATMDAALDVIALLALTGARRSEIQRLRWRHLDMAGRRIVLPPDEHKSGRKTHKVRVISLSDEAMAILRGYERGEPASLVFEGSRAGSPVDLAAPWRRVREAAGLERSMVLHSLRHGVGSALAAAGRSAPEIAVALGHSGWGVTQRYCHAHDVQRVELAAIAARLVRPQRLQAVF